MKKLTSIALCVIMMLALVLSASALELDAAENAAVETAEEASLSSDIGIPLVDENYGKLIVFKDFEQENATNKSVAYFDSSYMTGTSVTHASASSKIADNPVEGQTGKVLEVTGTGWTQFFVTFNDFYVQPGKYQVVYDYYSTTSCGGFMERYFTNIKCSRDAAKGDELSQSPAISNFNTGAWATKAFTALTAESLSDESGTGFTVNYGTVKNLAYYNTDSANLRFTQIGVMPNATSITYYLDNIKLYYYPENAVIYKLDDGALKMVEYDTDTVTIPSLSELDEAWTLENFRVWTDGTNVFIPGKTCSLNEFAGKTLTPMVFEKPLYDETKGELAVLFSFDGKTSKTAPTFLNPEYFPATNQSFSIRSDGTSYDLAEDTDGNKVMKVTVSNKTVYLFGYYWFNNIAAAAERVTLDFDMKVVSGAEALAGKSYEARFSHSSVPDGPSEMYKWGSKQAYVTTVGEWNSYSSYIKHSTGIGTFGAIPQTSTDKNYVLVMYHDNIAIYVKPSSVTFSAQEGGEAVKTVEFKGDSAELTFPSPSDIGVDATDFVAWTNGEDYYKAGETIAYTNADNPDVKAFYPFYQSADVPAVISLLEGTEDLSISKTSYDEAIEDDGRDVIHIHYWATTWTDSYGRWLGDPRTHLHVDKFDASEYGIVEAMVKSPMSYNAKYGNDKNCTEYAAKETFTVNFFNYVNENHSITGEALYQINGIPVDNEYHLARFDMKDNPNSKYPWENTGWGAALDVCDATYAADVYYDYFRIYRWGATTVNYDTNAPEGVEETAILAEVAPETGRGLGTGYLLTGLRPEIEGYVFKGWATSADSTETVEYIDLTGDTTVYAVWEAADGYITPEMISTTEIKGTGDSNGIRFKSTIKPSIKENLDEFGFLATREVLLPVLDADAGTRDYNALTFAHKVRGQNADYFVKGVAYDADGSIDVVNSATNEGDIVYTAVLSGIPIDNKNEKMVVRPYAKYEIGGNAVTIYGSAVSGSLYETAKAVKDAAGEEYTNNKTYIDSIVPDAE